VRLAFRAALAQPTVRTAVKAEFLRQLRINRPVALIDGYWVTLIDMGKVYDVPAVRAGLLTNLPAGSGIQVDAAILDPGRLGISFTPGQLGSITGSMARDLMASLGVDAMKTKITDLLGPLILGGLAGMAIAGTLMLPTLADNSTWADWIGYGNNTNQPGPPPPPYDPYGDPDGDGQQNYKDNDDDNDGYPDGDPDTGQIDEYPEDPDRHICDCGRPGGVFFGASFPQGLAAALFAALDLAKAQTRAAISLGAVQAGTAASIRVVIP
jgi:hypothetical protein